MTDFFNLPLLSHLSPSAQRTLADSSTRVTYPPLEDTHAWLEQIDKTNRQALTDLQVILPDVKSTKATIAGVDVYIASPPKTQEDSDDAVCLSFHGGALINLGGEVVSHISRLDAYHAGILTWGVDYRMPPLDPYPAGLEDGVAVYRALLSERDASDVFVAGSSAGGNIATATLLKARDEGLPMPAGLILFSPEVDLTESGDTFSTLAGVDNTLSSLAQVNLLYAAGNDLSDPFVSPLFGDLAGFPPTFLQSGTRDLFLSNTVRMHRGLRKAGVEAELHVFEAMPHSGFGDGPEHQELITEMRRFIHRHRR